MTQNKSKSGHDLEWGINGTPISTRFDDPYYSESDGRAETSHVFVNGNNLPSRWPHMPTCTIAELGFGTGLNFVETVRQWNGLKPHGARLNYISFEQYPMSNADMNQALSRWPELSDLSKRLADLWKPKFEILEEAFSDDVNLVVFMSDANTRLHQLQVEADAWYLDGFAPSRNPELWNAELMKSVFSATAPQGTFATYSCAGQVRRNLQAAGFHVQKVPGFGNKREMLNGQKAS